MQSILSDVVALIDSNVAFSCSLVCLNRLCISQDVEGVGQCVLAHFSVAQLHILRRVCKAFNSFCSAELAAITGPLTICGYYPGSANASHMNGLMPRKASTEQLNMLTMRWGAPDPPVHRPPDMLAHATAVALAGDSFVLIGGEDADGHSNKCCRWTRAKGWERLTSMAQARLGCAAVALADGSILVAGGVSEDDAPLRSAEVLRRPSNCTASWAWSSAGEMQFPRTWATAGL
eukprot:SAG31_NODE_696_length_12754_cov_9.480759_11_plen_232_part_01